MDKYKSIKEIYFVFIFGLKEESFLGENNQLHLEKSPARPMLFYSTNYWQQF